ncbi:hypothetical protein [Microbacterium luticocti]|uniref:hypothetical protein n=1 Tax=Microbacterium luticocti TaxID=451764 RepID=UPI00041F1A8E|nr:hypothetical protein [Microbacterium luticocti]
MKHARLLSAGALALALAMPALTGAAAPATSTPGPTATGASSSVADPDGADQQPVTVRPATATEITDEAVARVEAMSLRERAASVVMGHIPTTDTSRLAEYMADTGVGGFILMGANIPDDEAALRRVTTALIPDADVPR